MDHTAAAALLNLVVAIICHWAAALSALIAAASVAASVAVADVLPQAVRLADGVLPEAKCAVLAAAGVQFAVRREADAVDGAKVALEGFCDLGGGGGEGGELVKH